MRQLFQVVQRGAAPAIDGLVVVAHRGEARALTHQQFEQLVLRGVGVLVLIHQHMAHFLLPALAHLGVVAQQLEWQADQVVEIHALVGGEALLVARHDGGGGALVIVLGLRQRLIGGQPRALPHADGPLPGARGVGVGGAAAVFQQAGDVVGVEDAEVLLQAHRFAVFAQQANAQRVKGADQHLARVAPHQLLGALAHFGRGLVGEGDGGDAVGRQPGLDQPADLVRDHARLARARAGEHQTGAAEVVHGVLLGLVETGAGGGGHGGGIGKSRWRWARAGMGQGSAE